MGQLYLSHGDFLKNGVPAGIIATMVRGQNSYQDAKSEHVQTWLTHCLLGDIDEGATGQTI